MFVCPSKNFKQRVGLSMYIVMEGVDGSGKSTQIRMLRQYLEASGKRVVCTKEPGGASIDGFNIRQIVKTNRIICDEARELLFLVDRAEHMDKIVRPALDKGSVVISDRSFLTAMAYAPEDQWETLIPLQNYALKGLLPDICINIEISKETFVKRIMKRDGKFDQREEMVFKNFNSSQKGVVKAARLFNVPVLTIDGNQGILDVATAIKKAFSTL